MPRSASSWPGGAPLRPRDRARQVQARTIAHAEQRRLRRTGDGASMHGRRPCGRPDRWKRKTDMRILLAEDERELATWLVRALEQGGFQVDWVDDGRMVRRSLKATRYDALVLDLGLPGLGGHDVLADLRAADQRLPVLILTARDSLMERVSSLHEGADDFLAKPFELAELEARLVALIRRARGSDHPRFACGALSYDSATKQFTLAHELLALTPREHAVLRALIQRSGEPLSKQEILERVFSDEQDVHPEAIEVLIHRLRKRLETSPVHITTLRGLGYVLEPGR
jgi:two-component system response regulator TctD